jgi:hypothetical protein
MVKYFKRTLDKSEEDIFRSQVVELMAAEIKGAKLSALGWGKKQSAFKKIMTPWTLFSSAGSKSETIVKSSYLSALKVIKPDRRHLAVCAEAVFEEGKVMVKAEAKRQSIEAAKAVAMFAVKAGAAYAATQVGLGASTAIDIIEKIEEAIDLIQDLMDACESNLNNLLLIYYF